MSSAGLYSECCVLCASCGSGWADGAQAKPSQVRQAGVDQRCDTATSGGLTPKGGVTSSTPSSAGHTGTPASPLCVCLCVCVSVCDKVALKQNYFEMFNINNQAYIEYHNTFSTHLWCTVFYLFMLYLILNHLTQVSESLVLFAFHIISNLFQHGCGGYIIALLK